MQSWYPMPISERKTWFRPARRRSSPSTSCSPLGGPSDRGLESRIPSGTVASTSAFSDCRPKVANISWMSASVGPRCRRGNVSVGPNRGDESIVISQVSDRLGSSPGGSREVPTTQGEDGSGKVNHTRRYRFDPTNDIPLVKPTRIHVPATKKG